MEASCVLPFCTQVNGAAQVSARVLSISYTGTVSHPGAGMREWADAGRRRAARWVALAASAWGAAQRRRPLQPNPVPLPCPTSKQPLNPSRLARPPSEQPPPPPRGRLVCPPPHLRGLSEPHPPRVFSAPRPPNQQPPRSVSLRSARQPPSDSQRPRRGPPPPQASVNLASVSLQPSGSPRSVNRLSARPPRRRRRVRAPPAVAVAGAGSPRTRPPTRVVAAAEPSGRWRARALQRLGLARSAAALLAALHRRSGSRAPLRSPSPPTTRAGNRAICRHARVRC